MKWLFNLCIIFFAGLLPTTNVTSQTLSRYTTAELLNRARTSGTGFINSYPEIQVNYALPLIDSVVAVKLAKISGLHNTNSLFQQHFDYTYAIGLQCRDDSLKQILLTALVEYDKLCDDPIIAKNEYDQPNVKYVYEYSNMCKSAMLKQLKKDDTSLLKIATKEFEFWAPFAWGYLDTVLKPGLRQLSMGKRKFKPCLLASFINGSFWAYCIYFISGKEEYGSANDQLNEVYKKFMKINREKKDPDERKDFVRLGRTTVIPLTNSTNTLDSLDFETIPALREKFDKNRKNDTWQIIIYTHGHKGLIFLYYSERRSIGFSKQWVGSSSIYLAELNTPSTIQLTNIDYRERYY
jgi:hypothetical protein